MSEVLINVGPSLSSFCQPPYHNKNLGIEEFN